MSSFLSDEWEVSGKDIDGFKEAVKEMGKRTSVIPAAMNNVYFMSVFDTGAGFSAVPLHSGDMWKKTKTSVTLKRYDLEEKVYTEKGYPEDVVNEAFDCGLFLSCEKKAVPKAKLKDKVLSGGYLPVSSLAMGTVSNRIRHFGYGFLSGHLTRDIAVADKFDKPVPVNVVVRTDSEGNEKVFSVMSEKYLPIPQDTVSDLTDRILESAEEEFGTAVCSEWYVNHSISRIYLTFPEAGKDFSDTYGIDEEMTPGILIETSDIGDCALKVKGFLKAGSSLLFMPEEYAQIHAGKVDYDEILSSVEKNIFPKYSYYPEHLADLMTIDIVTDDMSESKKIKTLSSLYRKISKHIGLVKAIGKAREKSLIDQLIDAVNPDINYTAYDVAVTFLTLSKCVDTESRATVDAIARTVPAVLDYDFKVSEEKEEEDILVIS